MTAIPEDIREMAQYIATTVAWPKLPSSEDVPIIAQALLSERNATRTWQPIGTAPKEHGRRLLLIDELDQWPYIGSWRDNMGDNGLWMEDDGSSPDYQPDYWQPLPEPPIATAIRKEKT